MKETYDYLQKDEGGKLRCLLCPHSCLLDEGENGKCGVRVVKGGAIHSWIYGKVSSAAIDPIEKKPLYHFHPGSSVFSVGSVGCNFTCSFCQNHSISQRSYKSAYTRELSVDELVETALQRQARISAFTYNEPLIWFEYVLESCIRLREEGIKTVLVTNGYINSRPLEKLLPYIDAMNVDLKGSDDFYKKLTGASQAPVLKTIKAAAAAKVHVEVTTLLIEGDNDNDIDEISSFIASVNKNIPFHISKYFQMYKHDKHETSDAALVKAKEEAEKELRFVYLGNTHAGDANTYCPTCGSLLVSRSGYSAKMVGVKDGLCRVCSTDCRNFFVY